MLSLWVWFLTLQPASVLAEHLVSCLNIVKLVCYCLTWSVVGKMCDFLFVVDI
jgi:hypothetical protein